MSRIPFVYSLAVRTGLATGPNHDPESAEWRITRSLLERLRAAVSAGGARFLLVVIPDKADLAQGTYTFRKPLLDELQNFPCFDSYSALAEAGTFDTLYYDNDIHLRPHGHRVLGEALFHHMLRNSFNADSDQRR